MKKEEEWWKGIKEQWFITQSEAEKLIWRLLPRDICLRIEDRWLNKRRGIYRNPAGHLAMSGLYYRRYVVSHRQRVRINVFFLNRYPILP